MNGRKLKLIVPITALLSIVFMFISLKISHNSTHDSWPSNNYGWPFTYTRTIDTEGLCIGFSNEINVEGGCSTRRFPNDNSLIAYNIAISLVTATLIGVLIYRFSSKIV